MVLSDGGGSKKTRDVRICMDLQQLNREVRCERYVLPTLEDMVIKLNGATVFTHLDLTSRYYHVELHSDSTKLTTFVTSYGRYGFKHLPFGVTSASEIFQRQKALKELKHLKITFWLLVVPWKSTTRS